MTTIGADARAKGCFTNMRGTSNEPSAREPPAQSRSPRLLRPGLFYFTGLVWIRLTPGTGRPSDRCARRRDRERL